MRSGPSADVGAATIEVLFRAAEDPDLSLAAVDALGRSRDQAADDVPADRAADIDPDRVSFTRVLRLIRRSATGTADFSPSGLG